MIHIAHNALGQAVSVVRRGERIDIYVDGKLFDRDGGTPHWTRTAPRERPVQVCEVCGARYYSSGKCRPCYRRQRRRLGKER